MGSTRGLGGQVDDEIGLMSRVMLITTEDVTSFWANIAQAARATFILIPLLGLHYFLTPFRPQAGSEWAFVYEYIAAVTSSLQVLGLISCNHVLYQVKLLTSNTNAHQDLYNVVTNLL